MIRTKQQRRVNRRAKQKALPIPPPNANVVSALHGTSAVTVTFDSPVQISAGNLPTLWTFGATPRAITGITSATNTVYVFALDGTVAAADPYVIGAGDPAARTPTGGYVAATDGTLT